MFTEPSLVESAVVHGLGEQCVFTPWNTPFCASHMASVDRMQKCPLVPAGVTQQAPMPVVGGPHGDGLHEEPSPLNTPPMASHRSSLTTTQCALPLTQQAPVAGGAPQVVLVHAVLGPWNTPPTAEHCRAVASTQWGTPAALITQHAPTGPPVPHVDGLHVVPGPWNVPFTVAHWAAVMM